MEPWLCQSEELQGFVLEQTHFLVCPYREYPIDDNTPALQLESRGVVVSHSLDLVRALWMQFPMEHTLNRVWTS